MFCPVEILPDTPGKNRYCKFADGLVNLGDVNNESGRRIDQAGDFDGQFEKYG